MTHPVLKHGLVNPVEWVEHARKMLNMARPAMDLDPPLPETGGFDDAMEAEVKAFQGRAGVHPVDGIIGGDTWSALWAAVEERQQAHAGTEAGDGHQAGGDAHGSGVSAEHADPPPTLAEVNAGREALTGVVEDIVEKAQDFAERVSGLGEPAEVLARLVDAVHADLELANLLELSTVAEAAVFAGEAVAVIAVPFVMWYEAIQANNAGVLHEYRWQVLNAWRTGFWGGLYESGVGEVNALFTGLANNAYAQASGLGADVKKGALGLLLAMSDAMDYIPDESNPTISPEQWALAGTSTGYTWQGLETFISHHGG